MLRKLLTGVSVFLRFFQIITILSGFCCTSNYSVPPKLNFFKPKLTPVAAALADECKELRVKDWAGSPRVNSSWEVSRQLRALSCASGLMGSKRRLAIILELAINGIQDPLLATNFARALNREEVGISVGIIDLVVIERPNAFVPIIKLLKNSPIDDKHKHELIIAVQSSGERNAACSLQIDNLAPLSHTGTRLERLQSWPSFYTRIGGCLAQLMRKQCSEAFDVSDETNFALQHLKQTILNDSCGYGQVRAAPYFLMAMQRFVNLVVTNADPQRMLEIPQHLMRYRFLVDAVRWNLLVEDSLRDWATQPSCSNMSLPQVTQAWTVLQIPDAPHQELSALLSTCNPTSP